MHYVIKLCIRMPQLEKINIQDALGHKIFGIIGKTADEMSLECYVVGGYVRDLFLARESKDIDIVVVGSGIALAENIAKKIGHGVTLAIFKNFGTAQLKWKNIEIEFVGARKSGRHASIYACDL